MIPVLSALLAWIEDLHAEVHLTGVLGSRTDWNSTGILSAINEVLHVTLRIIRVSGPYKESMDNTLEHRLIP